MKDVDNFRQPMWKTVVGKNKVDDSVASVFKWLKFKVAEGYQVAQRQEGYGLEVVLGLCSSDTGVRCITHHHYAHCPHGIPSMCRNRSLEAHSCFTRPVPPLVAPQRTFGTFPPPPVSMRMQWVSTKEVRKSSNSELS